MELSPLLMSTAVLLLSLTCAGVTLRSQARYFEPLTTRTHLFDCQDTMAIVTNQNSDEVVNFLGKTHECMLPNLYKERSDGASLVEDIFAATLARCKQGLCP